MIQGIHHHAIQVRDLPRAERFYCDVLGLAVVRRWPAADGDGERSLWLGVGDEAGTFLALEVVPPGQPTAAEDLARGERPGHHLLALRIRPDHRARWEARLTAAGVSVTGRSDFTTYFTDPEGNRLGLSHYPHSSAKDPT
ncbi:MAG TPA: VOC family protein [Polyangia bacterium]|jgi:catechol 2,3-dioxygenase-like lactoylglutathione lyase family enzyme|nr:VOC family protein [Polyangia bacterium]